MNDYTLENGKQYDLTKDLDQVFADFEPVIASASKETRAVIYYANGYLLKSASRFGDSIQVVIAEDQGNIVITYLTKGYFLTYTPLKLITDTVNNHNLSITLGDKVNDQQSIVVSLAKGYFNYLTFPKLNGNYKKIINSYNAYLKVKPKTVNYSTNYDFSYRNEGYYEYYNKDRKISLVLYKSPINDSDFIRTQENGYYSAGRFESKNGKEYIVLYNKNDLEQHAISSGLTEKLGDFIGENYDSLLNHLRKEINILFDSQC